MNVFQLLLLVVCFAAVCAGPVSQSSVSGSTAGNTQQLAEPLPALSRPRRWILSWLLGHGAVIQHVDTKRGAANSTGSTRHGDGDESAEVHGLPGTVAVDLSGDTRVNYQDGHSRVGALAHESDAEVFDWNLLQDDKDKNAGEVNPHYYQSNSVTAARPGAGQTAPAYGQASSVYGTRRARPATGLLSNSGAQNGSQNRINAFNRFPISYEQSQEYANSRQSQEYANSRRRN